MDATADTMVEGQTTPSFKGFSSFVIPVSIILNILLGIIFVSLAVNLLSLEARLDAPIFGTIGDIIGIGGVVALDDLQADNIAEELGRPVQDFVGILVLLPAFVAFYGAFQLYRKDPSGRYLSIALHFSIAVLSGFAVLHFWGVFLSIESMVDGIMSNTFIIFTIPLAYALFWVGGRFDEVNPWRRIFELGGIGTIAIFAVMIFLFSDVLSSTNVIQVTGDIGAWVAMIMLALFGFLAYRMLTFGWMFNETPQQRNAWQGWFLLAPNIIGFMIFFAGPLLLSLYLSFTDSSVGQTPELNSFQNYRTLLSLEIQTNNFTDVNDQTVLSFGYTPLLSINTSPQYFATGADDTLFQGVMQPFWRSAQDSIVVGARDALFWRSIFNTIIFCLMLVPLSTIPALGLSLILNSKLPGVKFFRAIYFLPSVAAVVGTALIWRWLYDPTIGYFNFIISEVVTFLNGIGFGITDPNIAWLTGPGVMLVSIVFLAAWQVVGFNTVLFLAGLQGIPNVLYEAAMIDGANRWQQFRNVTVPMLAPTTFFVVTTTIITGLQVFNEPYALFPVRPLPEAATTGVFYIYNQGFNRFAFGYASSVAWLLFLLIFMVTFVQFRLQNSDAYDD